MLSLSKQWATFQLYASANVLTSEIIASVQCKGANGFPQKCIEQCAERTIAVLS